MEVEEDSERTEVALLKSIQRKEQHTPERLFLSTLRMAEGGSTYRWLRDGVSITAATAPSYTLMATDEAAFIVFEVTPVAVSGNSPGAAVLSAAVGQVTTRVHVLAPAGSDGYGTSGGRNNDSHLDVTVTLMDNSGSPVAGATESVTISGPAAGGGTGTLDAFGQIGFKITNAPPGTYNTTVTDARGSNLTWDGTTPPNSFDT